MNQLDAPPALGADVVVGADGRTSVRLAGELTVRTAATARDLLRPLPLRSPAVLHLDLEQLTQLDAAGLIAVTAPALACRRGGSRIEVDGPVGPDVRRAAERIGVLDLLPGPPA